MILPRLSAGEARRGCLRFHGRAEKVVVGSVVVEPGCLTHLIVCELQRTVIYGPLRVGVISYLSANT